MITCILIDDEQKALKILQKKLTKLFPDIEIIGAYQKPVEAIKALQNTPPDLLFLDISMPKMSGFDLLAKIDNPSFEIIFVTAYDNYAIQAIKHAAIGYVVKPIDNNELRIAVDNAQKNLVHKTAQNNNQVLLDLLTKKSNTITIPTQNGYVFLQLQNIIRLEGVEGYTKIVCDTKEYISSYSLGNFTEQLENQGFFQTHRSHIINLKYVVEYLNEGNILLSNKEHVPLSRSHKKAFFELMKNT